MVKDAWVPGENHWSLASTIITLCITYVSERISNIRVHAVICIHVVPDKVITVVIIFWYIFCYFFCIKYLVGTHWNYLGAAIPVDTYKFWCKNNIKYRVFPDIFWQFLPLKSCSGLIKAWGKGPEWCIHYQIPNYFYLSMALYFNLFLV